MIKFTDSLKKMYLPHQQEYILELGQAQGHSYADF